MHHNATNCEENLSDVGLWTCFDPLLDVWLDDDVMGEGGQVFLSVENVLANPLLQAGQQVGYGNVGSGQLTSGRISLTRHHR